VTAPRSLVTGAGGFIGSHLTERLVRDGHDVRAFVRYNSRGDRGQLELLPPEVIASIAVVSGDLRDIETVRRAARDRETIFHLGALIGIPYSYQSPLDVVSANVVGTQNVIVAALDAGVRRLVHTSTSEVYGTAQYVPIDEEHPLQAQSPYAATKIAADKLVESYWRSFDLPAVTLRPFNTFGPRQSARAIIPTIIAQLTKGATVRLGSLTPSRDFTYVADTVDGFVRAATTPGIEGAVLNLGTGSDISIGELVKRIAALLRVSPKIETDPARVRPAKSEVARLCAANARARDVMGWVPRTSLDDGLRTTIEWMRTAPARRVESYAV